MINFKTYYDIICEGGNVFKKHPTSRIDLAYILPTVQFLSTLTGQDLTKTMFGSTGKRPSSGDLDLGIDETKLSKQELVDKLTRWCIERGFDPKEYIAKSGISVHFRTPIIGNEEEMVQTDFMFVPDPKFAKFAIANNESIPFKGVHWNLVMSNLAKNIGLKWGGLNGLRTRTKPEEIIENQNPDRVAQLLLGDQRATAKNLYDISSIFKFLLKKYRDVTAVKSLLSQAQETILKTDNINIFELLKGGIIQESQTSTGARVGVQHLYTEYKPDQYSMSFDNFKTLIDILNSQGGIIQPANSSLSEKADGMSVKFGVTTNDEFFLQGSGKNAFSTSGDFTGTIKHDLTRNAFESNFQRIKKLVFKQLLKYKKHYELNGIRIQAEWLYSPFALHRDNLPGVVYFVATNYEKDKLGEWSTFPIINITDIEGAELPAIISSSIEHMLTSLSNDDVKFLPLNIEVFEPINLSSDVHTAVQQIKILTSQIPNYVEILSNPSRKREDQQNKKELLEKIKLMFLPIQRDMHNKILKAAAVIGGKLGEFEGIVVKLKDESNKPFLFKVINTKFHTQKGRI